MQVSGKNDCLISDLSRCEPASALSPREHGKRWQLFSYHTQEAEPQSGIMIGAPSHVAAPEVTLPLGVSGWHAISVGFWIPEHDHDGGTAIKVKLDNDPCFTRIGESADAALGSGPRDGASLLKEVCFKSADLTGRHLVFAKVRGPFAKKAYIAYVRLTPLAQSEVQALQADWARTDTRRIQATIDGISYLFSDEYRAREDILELVEPYRNSDVGKVTWAFCYGDSTNYPSSVGTYWAGGLKRVVGPLLATSPYSMGAAAAQESLRRFEAKGIIPQAVVAEHVHAMGLKFEAMFRLGIFGHVPPRRWGRTDRGFVQDHPQFRLVMADGTPVEKASYAFPEVRAHMLAIIRESAERFDIDGASLAFNRGPFFAAYEQPVLDDFRKEFGEDARTMPLTDPRLQKICSRYLTAFVREVRRVLDEVGAVKGKRLELSVWYEGQTPADRESYGIDVERWIREGLLDSVVGSVGKTGMDPMIIAAARAQGCRCIPGFVCSGGTQHAPPKNLLSNAAKVLYPEGAEGIALWDSDTLTATPLWPAIRRMGHREEFFALAESPPERPFIALKDVNGCNMETENGRFGLGQAAYSCG